MTALKLLTHRSQQGIRKSNGRSKSLPLVPMARTGPLPLSFAQQRLWFLEQVDQGTGDYIIPVALRLCGVLNVQALERSFTELIRRHEMLRTTFQEVGGVLSQVIEPESTFTLSLVEVEPHTEFEQIAHVEHIARKEAQRPFDLRQGPLMRATLLKLHESEHVLLVTMHHIVSDGWSRGVFNRDLISAYEAYCAGQEPTRPELSIQYADFAAWQREWLRGEAFEEQLAYWKLKLAGAPPVLSLPTDRPRSDVKHFRSAKQTMALSAPLTAGLKALSQREGVTLFMLLLAAFKVLLARYTGVSDILVGSPIANRNRIELENLIGFFVNTLVLRTDLSQNPPFPELLSRVREGCLGAFAHQDLPFEKLVEELRPQRDMTRHPLFQIFFVLQNAPSVPLKLPGLEVDSLPVDSGKMAFDLSFSLCESKDAIQGTLTYSTDLFDDGTIGRMLGHYQALLGSIVENPDQPISALSILTEKERYHLLEAKHLEVKQFPKTLCIHELIERQVEKNPDKIAVLYEDQHVTYRELNERANQLAHHLRNFGVGPEVPVAVFMERSVNMIVGLLSIFKAGGAYVPLDRAYPKERVAFMLADAQVHFVVTEKDLAHELPNHQAQEICIDVDRNVIAEQGTHNPMARVTPDNLAYVIFTSGSTGQPKGVSVTHDNIVRLFEGTQTQFQFSEHDVWTLFHSFAFDFSVWELWGALRFGGTVVVVPYWVSRSPKVFYELLVQEHVTVLNQTPSGFQQLIQAEESAEIAEPLSLRLVIFGGESLDLQRLKPWFDRHGDQCPQLINMYGITETTVHVTQRLLSTEDLQQTATSVIGSPIPDLQVFILDNDQQPVPIGIPGEMYIGGEGVTRGYLNHPELTGTCFIPNPYSHNPGTRLYRSGDLARYLSNGDIEYLGRVDDQVKIRGFRIELGEIESILTKHPKVRESVAIVREDQQDSQRLVAYIVWQHGESLPVEDLRRYLGMWLPDHMIPSAFVPIDSLPLTIHGKVDRNALLEPEATRPHVTQPLELPRTPVEQELAKIWCALLGVDQVGIHDDFFDLGGHSLLLTQLANRIFDTFQISLPLRTLFDLSTIEQMTLALLERQVETIDETTIDAMLQKLDHLSPNQVSQLLDGT